MAQAKLVRNLGAGELSLLQLMQKYVFGDKDVEFYNPTVEYKEGDIIIYKTEENYYTILTATEDNTGTFDITKWKEAPLSDVMANISLDKFYIISLEPPTEPENVIWLKPIDKCDVVNLPNPSLAVLEEFGGNIDTSVYVVRFSEDFPVAEDEDVTDPNAVYFDPEGTDTVPTNVSEKFENAYTYNVDEQEDVIVAGEAPASFSVGDLLFDTDLSNEK